MVLSLVLNLVSCKEPGAQYTNVVEISHDLEHKEVPNNESGVYKEFYKDGVLKIKGKYELGKKTGIWIDYNSIGEPEKAVYMYNDSVYYSGLDPQDYVLEKYPIKGKNVIDLPVKWDKGNIDNSSLLLTCTKKCKDQFCPTISITYTKLKGSFHDLVEENIATTRKEFDYFKIVSGGEVKINNLRGEQYSCITIYNGIKLGLLATFILKDDDVYIITSMALNDPEGSFLKYQDLFVEIASTFTL